MSTAQFAFGSLLCARYSFALNRLLMQGVLNLWDAEASEQSSHTTIAVTGAYGGYTIDFREMAYLCKLVVYITDVRHRETVYRTMREYIGDVHPVSTGFCVSALARPKWLVEIDATFVIPD